jgi:DNA-binding SARP family transcriptional activator
MASLRVQLLGKASIRDKDQMLVTIPAKAQELFFYLLLHGNQLHEREVLSALLWADISADRSKKYFRQALWQLQSTLNDTIKSTSPLLLLDGNWVSLDLNPTLWLDISQISQTFEQVRDAAGQALTPEQAATIQEAVALYQGELLTGWYQDWCVLERERFQSTFLALLDKLCVFSIMIEPASGPTGA